MNEYNIYRNNSNSMRGRECRNLKYTVIQDLIAQLRSHGHSGSF